MADTTITVMQFKHEVTANSVGQLVKKVRLTIRVGSYGPFTKDFDDDANLVANVQNWKAAEQAAVQAIAGGV